MSGTVITLAPDGIVFAPSTIDVSTQAELNAAVVSLYTATSGDFTILFTGDIDESGDNPAGIYAIDNAPTGVNLTIDGAGYTLNGGGTSGGLAVITGRVTIEDLNIEDTLARGGDGSSSGGGGAGLGGGLFVGQQADVTVDNVNFTGDAAVGGNGGVGGGGGDGGDASLLVPPLGLTGASGSRGETGVISGADGRSGPGGDGGSGAAGGPAGFGRPGGGGGDGGFGGTGAPGHAAEGYDGGAGGNGGAGGIGATGGAGGNGGDGGFGGEGGGGGNRPHGNGYAAGADGAGGGGAGGNGGFVHFGTSGSIPIGGAGAAGSATGGPGYQIALGNGFNGGTGAKGSDGGAGGNAGNGGFGGGGGGGGNGGRGFDGYFGGPGGRGADSYYTGPTGPLPTPPRATNGGNGGDGGAGGNGGDGGNGGAGGFGGGGGGGGVGGEGGGGGRGGSAGPGGIAYTAFIGGGRTFPGLAGNPGAPGADGESGEAGDGGQGQNGGFGGGFGASGGNNGARTQDGGVTGGGVESGGGGGLGAVGDIFVAQGGILTVDGGLLSGGSVSGGAGGTGAQGGGSHGNGIFLQGNETITLSASAGQTLTIDDAIADQTGSGGKGSTAATGSLIISGTGKVKLDAANSFHGGIRIESGTLDLAAGGAAGSGAIYFAPTQDPVLEFSLGAIPTNEITGFIIGDSLQIDGFSATQHSYNGNTLTLDGPGGPINLDIPGLTANDFQYSTSGTSTNIASQALTDAACFAKGTRILTAPGALVRVEDLREGDELETYNGQAARIVWIGRRTLAPRRHPRPNVVQPILITAGALGGGLPWRDLVVSPDHALYLERHLIPAKALTNGFTVRQLSRETVTYYHIELPEHAVLFAEGAGAESYLETGNRTAFENGWRTLTLHPDFAQSLREQRGYAPFAESGHAVEAARQRILAHAGIATTSDPDLQIHYENGGATIASRSAIPGELFADPRDRRRLGVKIGSLQADGHDISLDHPALTVGWHRPESDGRWTNGRAEIPMRLFGKSKTLQVSLTATLRYPLGKIDGFRPKQQAVRAI